jgi:hypothetical protein
MSQNNKNLNVKKLKFVTSSTLARSLTLEDSFLKEVLGMNLRLGASWCLRNGGASTNVAPTIGANFSVGKKFRLKNCPLFPRRRAYKFSYATPPGRKG